jgi:signal transduction histidine kinase
VAPKAQSLELVRSARRTQVLVVGFSTLVVLLAAAAALLLCRRLRGLLEREVTRKTQQLREKQKQIVASRRELAAATNKAAELIETAAREQNLGLYFHNPHLATCWKVRGCSNTWCPCHGREGVRCWQFEGTYCDQEKPASFTHKVLECRACEVYRRSCPDRLTELAEGFNTMMHLLRHKAEEMRQLRYHVLQRQRMATIGQMAAGIAHDIDNPIASLFSLVQLLSASDLDQEAKDRLALMRQCIERISKTVRQVVDFGRPLGQDEWTYGDVRKTIEDTVNLLRYDRRARTVDLAVECEPDLPKTMVIEHQLQQVFMNIMVNALDAMGGAGELNVRATRANGAIEVAISDTGRGMRPEQIQHIFEPFYTTKAGHKGTGLGLALSFSSIQRHGGTIRVDSDLGKGSTFTISIPLRSPDGGNHAPRQDSGR